MPVAEVEIPDLKRAYQLFDVPSTASALSIKQAYHRLVRRWHPDLYPASSPAYAEATQMMKRINEAYSTIAHAPLRYHIESYPRVSEMRSQGPAPYPPQTQPKRTDILPIGNRFEFWLRFTCGALLGVFMSFTLLVTFDDEPKIVLAGSALLILLCAFGSARYGDQFWSKLLEYGWLWW